MAPRAYRFTAIGLLVFLFAVNVYRAGTQSVTIDEAFTYNQFVEPPLKQSLTTFDANHHILHTYLCKLSTKLFGLSELSLRLTSLLGGLLYFYVIYRLCRYLFGSHLFLLLSVSVLSLNPFVLDYLSAARGYSLALGLFLFALWQQIRYLSAPQVSSVYSAGVALGCSVACNLTFAPVAAASASFFIAILLSERGHPPGKKVDTAIGEFLIPAVVTAFLVVVLPLSRATRDQFYVGVGSLHETLASIANASFDPVAGLPNAWGRELGISGVPPLRVAAEPVILVIMIFLSIVWAKPAALWVRTRSRTIFMPSDLFLLLGGGTFLLTLAGFWAAHQLFQTPYPFARTGLYLVPLFVLSSSSMVKLLERRKRLYSLATVIGLLIASVWLIQFAARFRTSHYSQWYFNAGTRNIVDRIRARQDPGITRKIRISANWAEVPGLNFYRKMYGLDWWEPVERKERIEPIGDYFVFFPSDQALLAQHRLTVLYTDPLSSATLAVNADSVQVNLNRGR